jgi:phage portal protein BeeE
MWEADSKTAEVIRTAVKQIEEYRDLLLNRGLAHKKQQFKRRLLEQAGKRLLAADELERIDQLADEQAFDEVHERVEVIDHNGAPELSDNSDTNASEEERVEWPDEYSVEPAAERIAEPGDDH